MGLQGREKDVVGKGRRSVYDLDLVLVLDFFHDFLPAGWP